MTREEVARKIRWPFIIWLAGLTNAVAMLPQIFKIIQTHNVQGLSLSMFVIYFFLQVAFSVEGYFTRNRMLLVCLGLSAVESAVLIGLMLFYR